jgi:hypothetical protein
MKQKMVLICAVGLFSMSCSNENAGSGKNLSGVYVREVANEVKHEFTGNTVGIRKIRDTIFVESTDKGFMISNMKWRLLDYDQDGWIRMRPGGTEGPLPTFQARYDETSKSLIAENELISYPLTFDESQSKLFKGKTRKAEYLKIK